MTKEIIAIDPQLAANLRAAKQVLAVAQVQVTIAESAIYSAAGDHIPEKGTVHLTGVKISAGFSEKWDQEKLKEIETTWPRKSNLAFPFKKEFKADGRAIAYLRENAKGAYDVLAEALTLTPRKPSFELED
jgi:hypothetical protein